MIEILRIGLKYKKPISRLSIEDKAYILDWLFNLSNDENYEIRDDSIWDLLFLIQKENENMSHKAEIWKGWWKYWKLGAEYWKLGWRPINNPPKGEINNPPKEPPKEKEKEKEKDNLIEKIIKLYPEKNILITTFFEKLINSKINLEEKITDDFIIKIYNKINECYKNRLDLSPSDFKNEIIRFIDWHSEKESEFKNTIMRIHTWFLSNNQTKIWKKN